MVSGLDCMPGMAVDWFQRSKRCDQVSGICRNRDCFLFSNLFFSICFSILLLSFGSILISIFVRNFRRRVDLLDLVCRL